MNSKNVYNVIPEVFSSTYLYFNDIVSACCNGDVISINTDDIHNIRILVNESKNAYCVPIDRQIKNCYNVNDMLSKVCHKKCSVE